MTRPAFWIASLAVFILVHLWMWLLSAIGVQGYESPAFGAWSWYLGQLAFSIMFVFIYSKGMSGAKGEGFRYGLFLGLLWYLPGFFMNWPAYGFEPRSGMRRRGPSASSSTAWPPACSTRLQRQTKLKVSRSLRPRTRGRIDF